MWKFCGISQFPWRKRCFSAKPLALFPWEMAVCFPPAPRHAWRDHGQLCSLLWLGGFEEGHFSSTPPRSSGATVLPICQQGWKSQNIRHGVVDPNGSSAEGWKWKVVLLNHLSCFIKSFWIRWSEEGNSCCSRSFQCWRIMEKHKGPSGSPTWSPEPCMGACCILLLPRCGRDRLCSSLSALDWTCLMLCVIILF